MKYIDQQKMLCWDEKYEYLKTLRAQLSISEQYLLFFNSISTLGRAWELEKLTAIPYKHLNSYLISKYNFIRNIPDTYYADEIQIKDFYPLVAFEFDQKPTIRTELETKLC